MPELPDLVHIVRALSPELEGRAVLSATVKESIVLRVLIQGSFGELLGGARFRSLERHGPFLHFSLERNQIQPSGLKNLGNPQNCGAILADQIQPTKQLGLDLIMHLMLTGRLRLATRGEKRLPYTAFSLILDDGRELSYADEKKMGKIYLCESGQTASIPLYESQGVDVASPAFTWELFESLIARKRSQARVFVMDQTALSAIGNAYADEILFEAGIHPKTPCYLLSAEKRRALYESIKSVLAWGVAEVEAAGAPLEDKVRGHMRVRNRAGEKCPRCGATIRKAGVLGYDAFFCPVCQPDLAGKGLDWKRLPPA
jgi:formamidopyrimidine-DNA glycosylase